MGINSNGQSVMELLKNPPYQVQVVSPQLQNVDNQEGIKKSHSLTSEEKHMATLLVERSCIDFKSQLSMNDFSNIPTSDGKYLLPDNSRANAWSASYVLSWANHDGICGWNNTSPGPLDSILHLELAGKEFLYTRIENVKILSGIWNVGQGRPSHDSLISLLGFRAKDDGVVVVGLQEVEMDAGVLALSIAKKTIDLERSTIRQWWMGMIGKTLDEGSTFEHVSSRPLGACLSQCGLEIVLEVMLTLQQFHVDLGVPLKQLINEMRILIMYIEQMKFCRSPHVFNAAVVGSTTASQMLRGTNFIGKQPAEGMSKLVEVDLVIVLGNFNYRLDGITYDEARDIIFQRYFDRLREKDQHLTEREACNFFLGMREAAITFPPTYKFDADDKVVEIGGLEVKEPWSSLCLDKWVRSLPIYCPPIGFLDL
ncbi:type II inositol polyphosphate 5-phosphatase 15-like [Juglans microcarpa x Juglans regia]|uniref:type II inositol polyphosphate 5-phosphatase 15-like n=1 Tax=Juglans microcarpa x Juglans regia TaxID=2249226 RepID=UPI001B7EC314|nr:type II inositol polyphosphate 5-phosphatase 15-like [Juglans microcarpa x Juglans regia]